MPNTADTTLDSPSSRKNNSGFLANKYDGPSVLSRAQTLLQEIRSSRKTPTSSPKTNKSAHHFSTPTSVSTPLQTRTTSSINAPQINPPVTDPIRSISPVRAISPTSSESSDDDTSLQRMATDFNNTRALQLLLQVPIFDGKTSGRFSEWIRRLDSVIELTQWSEDEKKLTLKSRLIGPAYDVYTDVYLAGDTYVELRDKIKQRYHGEENHEFFQREFEDRTRKPGESVTDFAYSLKYLFTQAYPLVTTAAQRLPFLKRSFLKGVSSPLRQALIHFEYNTFEDLVAKAVAIDSQQISEKDEASKNAFIRSVNQADASPSHPPALLTAIERIENSIAALQMNNTQSYSNNRPKFRRHSNAPSTLICGWCGRIGHKDDRCFLLHPELRSSNPRGESRVVCCVCHQPGHLGRNCVTNQQPSNRGSEQGQGNA